MRLGETEEWRLQNVSLQLMLMTNTMDYFIFIHEEKL
jgi:hypothetical protein